MAGIFSFGGIVSGIDTTSMIDKLMQIERKPITSLGTKKDKLQTKTDALRDINTRLSNLFDKVKTLRLQGTLLARKATTDTPSTISPFVNISVSANAVPGTFKLFVDRLATSTSLKSSAEVTKGIDSASPLANAGLPTAVTAGNFTIGSGASAKTYTIADPASQSLDDIVGLINADTSTTGVVASLSRNSRGEATGVNITSRSTISPTLTANPLSLGATGDTSNFFAAFGVSSDKIAQSIGSTTGGLVLSGNISGTITVNGTAIALSRTDNPSAQSNASYIADEINAQRDTTGVMASVIDRGGGNFALRVENVAGGAGSDIDLTLDAGAAATGLTAGFYAGSDIASSQTKLGGLDQNGKLAAESAKLVTPLVATGEFKINGVTIKYDATTDSIATIISKINTSTVGVTATFDTSSQRLNLTAKADGSGLVTLEDVTGNFLSALKVKDAVQSRGQTALYRIDSLNGGQQIQSQSNKILDALPGVNITLARVSAGAVAVTVSQDTAPAAKAISDYVSQVNSVFEIINKNTAYDSTLKKASILMGDSLVTGIASRIRNLTFGSVSGLQGTTYRSLSDIGITSGALGSAAGTTNELVLDEVKLTRALEENPNAVFSLFNSEEGVNKGVAKSLEGYLKGMTESGGVFDKRMDSSKKEIEAMSKRISIMEDKLTAKEDSLVKKFAALEVAMAKLQQQSSSLSSQMSAFSSSSSNS